jgi:hypothetical protein
MVYDCLCRVSDLDLLAVIQRAELVSALSKDL